MNRTKAPPKKVPTIKRTQAPPEMVWMVEYFDKNRAQRFGEVIKTHKNKEEVLVRTAYGEREKVPVNKIINKLCVPANICKDIYAYASTQRYIRKDIYARINN